jgi:FMN phosphatase YigB (HAD superfamily)
VISANDVGIPKREARMWDAACRMAGTDKAATWAFDDSLYALDAARAAGYRVVGTYSHDMCSTHDELREHADIAVENLGELDPELLRARR